MRGTGLQVLGRVLCATLGIALLPGVALADTGTAGNIVQSWMNGIVQGCWACTALDSLSSLGLSVADQTYTALAANLATLLGLIMAIWIVIFAGRLMLPFGPDHGGLGNEGARKLLHFAVVLAFLQGSSGFWDYVFTPLLATGIGIASTIITIGDPTSSCSGPATGGSGLSGAQSVMQGINCPMAGIQSQFAEGMAIGVAVLVSPNACPANNSTLGGFIIGFSQSMFSLVQMLMNVICGLVLIVIYFFDYLAFPLLLLDVILRATVIAVISPVALAASLFGPTRHLAKKAAWGLVQAGLTLVFAAVVGAIGKSSIAAIFSGLATNGTPITDWNSLSAALSDPCGSGLSFGLTSPAFYKVAGLGVMLIYMMRKASGMAADFTGAAAGDWTGGRAGVATVIGNGMYMIGGTIDAARGRIAGGGGGVRKDIAAAVSGRSAPDEEND